MHNTWPSRNLYQCYVESTPEIEKAGRFHHSGLINCRINESDIESIASETCNCHPVSITLQRTAYTVYMWSLIVEGNMLVMARLRGLIKLVTTMPEDVSLNLRRVPRSNDVAAGTVWSQKGGGCLTRCQAMSGVT